MKVVIINSLHYPIKRQSIFLNQFLVVLLPEGSGTQRAHNTCFRTKERRKKGSSQMFSPPVWVNAWPSSFTPSENKRWKSSNPKQPRTVGRSHAYSVPLWTHDHRLNSFHYCPANLLQSQDIYHPSSAAPTSRLPQFHPPNSSLFISEL